MGQHKDVLTVYNVNFTVWTVCFHELERFIAHKGFSVIDCTRGPQVKN